MRLNNEFVVPRPVDEAWTVLTDVERIAPCMPGAQLTEVVGDSYHGTVKVKVGPVVAQYGGAVRFTEMDAERHRVVLEAKGKERNGRGLASALVTADLTGEDGSTRVTVSTDLTISGPLAQFGRGAIAEVSSRLLNQFVDRLKETVLQEGTAPSAQSPAQSSVQPAAQSSAGPAVAGAAAADSGATAPAPRAAGASETAASPVRSGAGGAVDPGGAADPDGVGARGAGTGEAGTPEAGASAAGGAGEAGAGAGAGEAGAGARTPVAGPEAAAPADLLRVAAVPILKRVLPPLILIVVVIVVLAVWLG